MPGVMMLSRDLKRVPLDFDWPLNKVWDGYLSPDFSDGPCPTCSAYDGHGWSPAAHALQRSWYAHIVGDDYAWFDKLGQAEVDHHYENDSCFWTKIVRDGDEPGDWHREKLPKPTATEVNEAQRAGLMMQPIDVHRALGVRCQLLGIEETCQTCDGQACLYSPGAKEREEAWEPTEPPAGEGFQLWESVSEGSPVSPVFDTALALAQWLAVNDTSILRGKSVDAWLAILNGEVHGTDIQTGALV